MSISAIGSPSAASQLSFLSRLSSTNSASSAQGVRPPPPPDGGGFADAIAEALKSIGISDSGSDATAATASTDTSDTTDVTAAQGSFLQSLMGALHAQRSESAEAPPPYGEQQGGASDGPGELQSDLQSLLSKLTSGAVDASADGDDAVGELESSFANLLDKLGGGTSTAGTDDIQSTDAAAKLASFLQALSTKVGGGGGSGNLVNTTV